VADAEPSHDDAPNILVILIDDLGFLSLQLFGSDLVTPNIDELAATASVLELPRHAAVLADAAALLTGRNHHSVGMRGRRTGAPAFQHAWTDLEPRDQWPKSCASTVHTFAVGSGISCRWRTRPRPVRSTSGRCSGVRSLLRIPDGETDQFAPDLTYAITGSSDQERGRRLPLSEDLVDPRDRLSSTDANQFDPTVPSSTYLASARRTRPTAPGEYSSVTAAAMTRAGTLLGPNGSRTKGLGIVPEFTELAPVTTASTVGRMPEVQKKSPPDCKRPNAGSSSTPTPRSVARPDLKTIGETRPTP